MKKERLQRRLEVTTEQMILLEGCITETRKSEADFDHKIYRAMITQYESVRDDLKAERDRYRQELGLD